MKVVALAGGVGGARLARGLDLAGADLTVIVNTGDDFRHLGLHVSPDIDTVAYTLAGLANREQGWGLAGESWAFMEQVRRLGGPDWFSLGDRDLAMHVLRSERLAAGESLSKFTADVCERLSVGPNVVPMTDDSVRTVALVGDGEMAFQDWFVRHRAEPEVSGFRFDGIEEARPSGGALAALADPDLDAVILCPSNPYVSIAPILGVPGLRDAIPLGVPVIAVSPIIAGAAVKGPAARIMRAFGQEVSALGIARHYAGMISGLVIDRADAALEDEIAAAGLAPLVTRTLMADDAASAELGRACLDFARDHGGRR